VSLSINQLKPQAVFCYFEEISKIPHGSGNEKAISDYLVAFAKQHALEVIQDAAMNIIIKKPATPGYENAPIVILQGHMDMVCEKNKETIHDFEKDPLQLRIIDDMLYATNTTLGADNGIAIAYALAILAATDIPHPALEVLITTEEETGMGGAMAIDPSHLQGSILINIDSEEEGHLLVSCAGGVRTKHILPIVWEDVHADASIYAIRIRGLKGGHSGMEIDKGRGNANKLMGRILNDLSMACSFQMIDINGGSKMNAIPRECDVILAAASGTGEVIKGKIAEWDQLLKNELRVSDPGVSVELDSLNHEMKKAFSPDTTNKAIASLVLIPNGVQTMSMDIQDLVESSTNLGVVTTDQEVVRFESAIRSSVKSLKYKILNEGKMVAKLLDCELKADSDYPEWSYNPDSKIRPLFQKVYADKYGKEAKIIAIHAGVECGLFKEKMEHLDMISFGPNMYDVHTPNEHLSISSTERTWDYLLSVLKEIK
jgi:dipeptidase D